MISRHLKKLSAERNCRRNGIDRERKSEGARTKKTIGARKRDSPSWGMQQHATVKERNGGYRSFTLT